MMRDGIQSATTETTQDHKIRDRSIIHMMRGVFFVATLLLTSAQATDMKAFKNPFLDQHLERNFVERFLQTPIVPIPPSRECGQVIGVTPMEVIIDLMNTIAGRINGTLIDAVAPLLNATIRYDIEARVVCSSCEQVATSSLSADTSEFGFGTYCGEDRYLYNATHSGLLFLPIDRETGKVIANVKLKGAVFAHSLMIDTTGAPSEFWPEDLQDFLASGDTAAFGALYNMIGGLFATGAGVVSIMPDYTGFGQSSQYTKSVDGAIYRQASIPLWLESQTIVKNVTNGCTELDRTATIGGYSEGGYASFAIGLSLQHIGVTILSCNSGGTYFNQQKWIMNVVDEYDQNISNPYVGLINAYASVTYSSTNPDLANTNVGQDALLKEWMNPNNFSMYVKGWISSDLSGEEAVAYLPLPDYLQIMNPNVTSWLRNAIAMNVSDPCEVAVVGETDKICEVAIMNDLEDDIASPDFPVILCHSPDDEVIPYKILFPDVNASENLTEFTLLGQKASGSHAEAALFCLFPVVFSFTSFNPGPSAVEQVPLDTCTNGPTPPPTSLMPTSSAYSGHMSIAPAVLASLLWIWNLI